MKFNKRQTLRVLRNERNKIIVRLVTARKTFDDLHDYRVGNLERELEVLNSRINRIELQG